ncbi:sulfurtransferase complex subunit TusD [Biostraticola tofi]|uniref:Sulfurtransferase TusD n=1 Tax=Biostraticola tofi TaxID=466109 RepID=A0A4R3YLG3_9GAMM|nr:sulfurtransferase complex subunit TusD [Biostraticola tofi]TCV93625.1 tRNA 2-thiouridine synthesizing protein D [Biostraticola tofi]
MSLSYCLMVSGPAYGSQQSASALQFARALLDCGHCIHQVFFYQDGVLNGNRLSAPATDEVDMVREWQQFGHDHQIGLHICVAAALRRGVTDSHQARALSLVGDNLQPGFTLSGLGALAQSLLESDRFVQF